LINEIINGNSYESIIEKIEVKISDRSSHNTGYYDLDWFISQNLAQSAKRKNLICRLSAMLEEDYKTDNLVQINKIKKALWETPIDIEHIQSYHDSKGERREEIWEEWGENIDSVGNLIILEQEINRSISNNPYELKIQRYPESTFSIVQNQSSNYPIWDLDKCLQRKEQEVQKMLSYLFN
jgi:hypothetical protein